MGYVPGPNQTAKHRPFGAALVLGLNLMRFLVWKVTLGRSYSPVSVDCQDEENRDQKTQAAKQGSVRLRTVREDSLFACSNIAPQASSFFPRSRVSSSALTVAS
jgi:hypothetical protein